MTSVPLLRAPIVLSIIAAILLSGCGGGNGNVGDGDGMAPVGPGASGSTVPVTVQIGTKTSIDSIHLEMTDGYVDFEQTPTINYSNVRGTPLLHDSLRIEFVCPGVPPRGNECIAGTAKIDGGTTHSVISPEDLSIDVQASLLETLVDRPSLYGGSDNGIQQFSATIRPHDLSFEALGGWGEYFGMYSMRSNPQVDFREGIRTYAASFGMLHSGYPTAVQGSATWRGPMVGHTRRGGVELAGAAELQYDFAANEVGLTLWDIDVSTILSPHTYSGPNTMEWVGLRVNADGSFYIPGYGNDRAGTDLHPTLGYVDGDFYGPNAEEMAGVFERDGVVGAFGGRRNN